MQTIEKGLSRFNDILQKLLVFVGSVMLTIFLLAVVAQMLCRYLGIMALWTEDVSVYSFIFSVFLGAAALVRDNRHFAFTALVERMKGARARAALTCFISLLILVFAGFMLYYGYKLTDKFWNYKWIGIPSFKRGPTWMCMPISACSIILFSLENIIRQIRVMMKGENA